MANDMADIDTNLRGLIKKLGHNLEEIRRRALLSILSKLEHGLIEDSDIVQEKHLHICLLEWFNFPSCPLPDKVLGLIQRLTKHSSAACIYTDIGAVEFFSQLKPNLSDSCQKRMVEVIEEQLFHLPSTDPQSHNPAATCVYTNTGQDAEPYYMEVVDQAEPYTMNEAAGETGTEGRMERAGPEEVQRGYFQQKVDTERVGGTQEAPDISSCFRFATFPWVALTGTDKHVISSTDSSLQSSDLTLVTSACEFLTDVVFQDFPAEVFLQRPAIIKSLLSLLSVSQVSVAVHAAEALHGLAVFLQTRIFFYQDPAFYTTAQDLATGSINSSASGSFLSQSNTRPPLTGGTDMRHSGDGQDGNQTDHELSALSDDSAQVDHSDMLVLQCLQWSIPQFCIAVTDCLLPILKTTHRPFSHIALQLLHQVAALLKESLAVDALWEDHSIAASEMTEKLRDWLEMLGDVLFLHHHSNRMASSSTSQLKHNRRIFTAVAIFTIELIDTMIPKDKVHVAIVREFVSTVNMLAQDEFLACSFPEVRRRCLMMLQQLDTDSYVIYNLAQHTCQSFKHTCDFLVGIPDMDDSSVVSLVEMAGGALDSLPYHQHMGFITGAVLLASYVCKKQSPNPVAVSQSRSLILSLLSHPLLMVRQETHTCLLSLVKESLGVEGVTEPTSALSASVIFILDRHILYQITSFGLAETDPKIRDCSEKIMVYLLQCQLLVPASRWQQLLESLAPVMAALGAYASADTTLGRCIVQLASTDLQHKAHGCLPLIERFRATLRLMFSKEPALRGEGLGRLAYFLSQEEDCLIKLPLFSDFDLSKLTNMFIINPPRSLTGADHDLSAYTTEALRKVLEIFSSEKAEFQARKSAGHQLAIMLQDEDLHGTFKKCGGVNQVILAMKSALWKPGGEELMTEMTSLLPHLLRILRCLIQSDSMLRHQMAHRIDVYYMVLRSGLLHHSDIESRREVAELFAMLLFDELASPHTWSTDDSSAPTNTSFSLPPCITDRYALPFTAPTHHVSSPYAADPAPEPDPLRAGLLAEMLRLSWNVAWHDGIDAVIKSQGRKEDVDEKLFSKHLHLTSCDLTLLSASYTPYALQDTLHAIENATSHLCVSQALGTLASYMVMAQGKSGAVLLDHLQDLKWKETLHRFFLTIPSSTEDESLFSDILAFITSVVLQTSAPPSLLQWLAGLIHDPNAALLSLIGQQEDVTNGNVAEKDAQIRRTLSRKLLTFLQSYLTKFPYNLNQGDECVRGDVAWNLLQCIRGQDTVQSYNLPALEGTLLVLMHITARPGWSQECQHVTSFNLCQQMLQYLLEVVSAFHVGRGGIRMSYMGRGVTRCASLCLHQLAAEMTPLDTCKSESMSLWLLGGAPHEERGLHWLPPMWNYRDPEVQVAGLGIAVTLASTRSGRSALVRQCQHQTGGVFKWAIDLLLDSTEPGLLRQQAGLLLVNMTSELLTTHPMLSGEEEDASDNLQVQGLPALLALLHGGSFYERVAWSLSSFYPQPAIHPLCVTGESFHAMPLGSVLNGSSERSRSPHAAEHPATHRSSRISTSTSASQSTIGGHSSSTTLTPRDGHHTQTDSNLGESPINGGYFGGGNYQQVTHPALVSAISRLLGNLVVMAPQDTLLSVNRHAVHKMLMNLLDVGLLEAYLTELNTTPYRAQFYLAYTHLLSCHHDILQLLQLCSAQDVGTRNLLLSDATILNQVVRLLQFTYTKPCGAGESWGSLEPLGCACLRLLTTLILTGRQQALASLSPILIRHWASITGGLSEILTHQNGREVWLMAVTLLGVIFSEEGQCRMEPSTNEHVYLVIDYLDSNTGESETSGTTLCRALIHCVDAVLLKSMDAHQTEKTAVMSSLKMLLAHSTTAKSTALQAGLMETMCVHLRTLHQKITKQTIDLKVNTHAKKRNPIMVEMQLTVDLIRNFCYQDLIIKDAACESGLSQHVHSIWSWCQTDPPLMAATLGLLAAYTAHCKRACSSLALTSVDAIRGQRGVSANSLLHAVIRQVQEESSSIDPDLALLRLGFTLLTTATLSPECRGVFCKSNFLRDFVSLTGKASHRRRRSKEGGAVERLWLHLLVNLSFTTEGQNMILNLPDCVELLLELASHSANLRPVALVLRNITFHAPNIPRLFANDKVVPFMLCCLESSVAEVRCIASSALVSLVHRSSKAKGSLKSTQLLHKIQDCFTTMEQSSGNEWDKSSVSKLQDLQILLQT